MIRFRFIEIISWLIFLLILPAPTMLPLAQASSIDINSVKVIYSNVFVINIERGALSIEVTLEGPYRMTGWLVVYSPPEPSYIIASNYEGAIPRLDYDPRTMPSNPIATTDLPFAWDYDAINKVVFIKFQLTSLVVITLYYEPPSPPTVAPYFTLTVLCTDQQGRPIEGAKVTILLDEQVKYQGETNGTGTVVAPLPSYETYTVTATYADQSMTKEVHLSSDTTITFEFVLPPPILELITRYIIRYWFLLALLAIMAILIAKQRR